MKKVAISQSNYIPWKGYFDMINSVDEFIIYDDMQFTKRDWRNRNMIKTPNGLLWLTIPVKVKGKFNQKINETEIEGNDWAEKHWKTIKMNYSKAPNFLSYSSSIESLYKTASNKIYLSEVNNIFLKGLCDILGINSLIKSTNDFQLIDGKTERLVDLCLKSNATTYVSGPAAKTYIDKGCFNSANIDLLWMDYSNYTPYPQKFGPFENGVTILDLLFNVGDDFKFYMKSFNGAQLHVR